MASSANYTLCATVASNRLQLNQCRGGDAQDWFKSAYGVQNGYHGLCLDTEGAASGAALVVVGCQNKPSQRWGYDTTTRALRNEAGFCADVYSGRAVEGQKIIAFTCNRQANQIWTLNKGAVAAPAAPAASAACADPAITKAVQTVLGRNPNGSGTTGECSPQMYSGNGQYSSAQDILNKVLVKFTNKGAAYVFVSPNNAVMQGHVGWAYVNNDGSYSYGATDAPLDFFKGKTGVAILPGVDSNVPWRGRAATEAEMFNQFRGHYSANVPYSEVKMTFVLSRNEGLANQRADQIKNVGYTLVGNNCMDHTYTVLAAYGVNEGEVMQWKQTHPAPNSWFRAFGGMDINGRTQKVSDVPGSRF